MFKNSKVVALICGATSIAATILFYLLTFDSIFTIPMRWISLLFLLLAEGIGTIKAFRMKNSVFGVANIITSVLHVVLVLAMSILFVNMLPLLLKTYILLNILALCVLLVADIIITYFGGLVGKNNKELADNQAVLETLSIKAKGIAVEYQGSIYKADLEEISDLLTYSDNTELSDDEVVILEKLEALQKALLDEDESVPQIISDTKNAIKLRSLKMKNTKRGSY